jgi:hypothetical protein
MSLIDMSHVLAGRTSFGWRAAASRPHAEPDGRGRAEEFLLLLLCLLLLTANGSVFNLTF